MNKIILCEGKTDSIIVSYYLINNLGWKYFLPDSKTQKELPLNKPKVENQSLNWYRKGGNNLGIYACGGIDNIPEILRKVIQINASSDLNKKISQIILLSDSDLKEQDEIKQEFKNWIFNLNVKCLVEFEIDSWLPIEIKQDTINETKNYKGELLAVVLPKNKKGNLETFLLDSLREKDGLIVMEAEKYIESLKEVEYLRKERYKSKAQLQSVSVISPEWVFTEINDRLKRVDWSKLENVYTTFSNFKNLDK